jgi:hypothetical protein
VPTERLPRLAVLIDADNTSAKIAEGLFVEIATLGEASVRRIYGDFASPRSKGWTDILTKYAIIPQQQFAYTTGKNASDITLVIDAMDLLHSGRFDGFCLVSSDSDFTRLASRIREEGATVFGFGEKKTPESFRQACNRFIYTENLGAEVDAVSPSAAATRALEQPGNAARLVRQVIAENASEDGTIDLGALGSKLIALSPDFDSRTYGFKKLSDLVRSLRDFQVVKDGGQVRVRFAPRPTKAAAKKSGA